MGSFIRRKDVKSLYKVETWLGLGLDLLQDFRTGGLMGTIFKNVFSQDPKNNQAIVIKAEGLYQMCRFEHAFALFSKVIELVRRALCNLRLTIIF